MDSDVIVCRCEEVTRKEVEEAIDEGRKTVSGIKRQTRAGMGACQGRTCTRIVSGILKEKGIQTGLKEELDTPRSPLVPFPVYQLGDEDER